MGTLDVPPPGPRLPPLPDGSYFFTAAPSATTTLGSLGIGTLRIVPFVLTRRTAIVRLGAEVTAAGDAGSKFRIAVFADNGASYPGALAIDAGQIAGDTVGAQELTVATTLPAGLWWIGGAVQAVTTTQPTMRCITSWNPPVSIPYGIAIPPTNANAFGYSSPGVTSAAPSQFTATLTPSGACARVFARTA